MGSGKMGTASNENSFEKAGVRRGDVTVAVKG